jgi:hypothetical protein
MSGRGGAACPRSAYVGSVAADPQLFGGLGNLLRSELRSERKVADLIRN